LSVGGGKENATGATAWPNSCRTNSLLSSYKGKMVRGGKRRSRGGKITSIKQAVIDYSIGREAALVLNTIGKGGVAFGCLEKKGVRAGLDGDTPLVRKKVRKRDD